MPLIPFSLNPKHWGLEGEERSLAEARYKLSGKALEYRLLEIQLANSQSKEDTKQLKMNRLDLDLKYGEIDDNEYHDARISLMFKKNSPEYKQAHLEVKLENEEIDYYEFDTEVLKLKHKDLDSSEYMIALAEIDLAYKKITPTQHEKQIATAKQEPWVKLIKADLIEDKEAGTSKMSFELDWNSFFVDDLISKGWVGISDEETVDQWFTHTCQNSMNAEDYLDLDEGQI